MRRRLFTIVSSLFLLLSLAALFMWVRSLVAAPEAVEWTRRNDGARSFHWLAVESGGGCLGVSSYSMDDPSMPINAWRDMMRPGPSPGFRYGANDASPGDPSPYRDLPGSG
jgi:hypothetical protein